MSVDLSSSSSSDEELRTALRRNARLRENNTRAEFLSLPRTIVYNNESVEVRCGTVYCPFRKVYFHIQSVKRNPAAFFGDGNVRRNKRSYLPPSSIWFLNASHGEEISGQRKRVTLTETNVKGFYIFDGIADSSASPPLQVRSEPLLQNFRYSRIMMPSRFEDALTSPIQLRVEEGIWKCLPYKIPRKSLIGNFPDDRLVFCDLESQSSISVIEDGEVFSCPFFASPQDRSMIGMQLVSERNLVVLSSKVLHHISWDPDIPLVLKSWTSRRLACGFFNCLCSIPFYGGSSVSSVFASTGHDLFKAIIREDDHPIMEKFHGFRRSAFSSLDAYSMGPLASKVLLCGKRDGSILVQPLETMRTSKLLDFGSIHNSASISYIRCLQNSFKFVSIASNGEVKLWDVRYMKTREPVANLQISRGIGFFHGVQATFLDDLACVAVPDGSVSCINLRKWVNIGQYRRVGNHENPLHLVRTLSGYQILDVGEESTMACSLHIV
ncbi:uncharacterized protein TM35_000211150 [Trypanosoma theileri]|uniref:Uncharacterized protein n=1 Tax=Trypanosoma theileri TaxID=67003 RepID=A0A1X0NTK2_9TRYP|nr:uncharacterized protein TM35_000211150 [Trypanosoma theileri]ORC87509.1 hypothetical protein TM35_000211150 [Trypanosoma theileri]